MPAHGSFGGGVVVLVVGGGEVVVTGGWVDVVGGLDAGGVLLPGLSAGGVDVGGLPSVVVGVGGLSVVVGFGFSGGGSGQLHQGSRTSVDALAVPNVAVM